MEDETITPEPDYVKGFNEGYVINQHLPEISEQLAKAFGNTERGSGFKDGWKQSLLERIKDQYPKSFIKDNYRDTNQDKEARNRDIEPEK